MSSPWRALSLDSYWDQAPCGFLIADDKEILRAANSTLLQWLGLPKEGVVGHHVTNLLTPAGAMYYSTVVEPTLLMQGEVREVALDLRQDDGASLPVFFSARLDAQSDPPAIRMTLTDARERRRYERNLVAANRDLQAMIEERNRILDMVTHDLRSPLTGILGLAQLLDFEDSDEHRREHLARIAFAGATMTHLLDDLLEVAASRAGDTMRSDLVRADLLPSLRETALVMEAGAKAKGTKVVLELPEQPLEVAHDPTRLVQALTNLVGNAIKFSPPGSDVVVRVECEDDDIVIVVADRGPGIAPHDVERIFQPFLIGDARPTAGERGAGLGLSIVRGIAAAHGGRVTVRPRTGGGSEFCLRIPRG